MMIIRPAHSLKGSIRPPGDKSISHRAAILAAIAQGETRITNFSPAEDCRTTIKCLKALGLEIGQKGTTVTVKGTGKMGLRQPDTPLDCGNSGTTARLLAGVLAAQTFDSILVGDASLSSRPMERVVEPLRQMGAKIESNNGCLPIRIFGGAQLHGIQYSPPVASAQLKSCLLFAGLFAKGRTAVVEQAPTRDHTERMLKWLGADVKGPAVAGDDVLTARDIDVPGDISSGAFLIAAAACLPGSDLTIEGVGLNPTRTAFIDVLKRAGAWLEVRDEVEICNEPRGTLRCRGGLESNELLTIAADAVPDLIDEIPVLAVAGTQMDGGIEIRDAAELRHKETDRIAAVVENLKRMHAAVEEFPDGLAVQRSNLLGTVIDPFGDHRIAMAFAVAGLLADGETEITGAECVDISFPGFFDTLAAVVRYE